MYTDFADGHGSRGILVNQFRAIRRIRGIRVQGLLAENGPNLVLAHLRCRGFLRFRPMENKRAGSLAQPARTNARGCDYSVFFLRTTFFLGAASAVAAGAVFGLVARFLGAGAAGTSSTWTSEFSPPNWFGT